MPNYGQQFDAEGLQFRWNPHSLDAWDKCPRYYQYTILEGWRNSNVHFAFGGAYAAALQRFYISISLGASRDEAICEAVRTALIETWDHDLDAEGNRIPGTGAAMIWDHNTKTRETLIRTIVWYFEQFNPDLPVLYVGGEPGVEQVVSVAVDDGNFLIGTMDRIVEWDGQPLVMDQKTTGSTIAYNYFEQWKPSTQMTAYTFLGQIVFPEPVKGVLIDATQIATGFSRFERGVTYRTKSELQEWYDATILMIEQARAATRNKEFPMRPASCHHYGGCAFRKICSKSPEVRRNFLHASFHKEPR